MQKLIENKDNQRNTLVLRREDISTKYLQILEKEVGESFFSLELDFDSKIYHIDYMREFEGLSLFVQLLDNENVVLLLVVEPAE